MNDLNPGNVALVVGAMTTLFSGLAAATVSILAALRATHTEAIERTLDQVHDKVNGAADAAAVKMAGLETEVATLKALIQVQQAAIAQLTHRTEELLTHIKDLEP